MRKIIQLYFLLFFSFAFSQTELVFVYFKDKPNASAFLANPLSELSQKALDRRTNLGIAITAQDAPIEPAYIQNIQNLGFTVNDKSKWLNGVAINPIDFCLDGLTPREYQELVKRAATDNQSLD